MPSKPPRPCKGDPFCPEEGTVRGRCPRHAGEAEAARNERRELSRSVYLSPRWRRLRRAQLDEHPYCQHERCWEPATDVDHILPIEEGGDPWDRTNLQSLCAPHHAAKSAREGRARRR